MYPIQSSGAYAQPSQVGAANPYAQAAPAYQPQVQPYTAPSQPAYQQAQPYMAPAQPAYQQAQPYMAPSQPAYQQAQPYMAPAQPAYQQAQPYMAPAQPAYPQSQPYVVQEQPIYPQPQTCPTQQYVVPEQPIYPQPQPTCPTQQYVPQAVPVYAPAIPVYPQLPVQTCNQPVVPVYPQAPVVLPQYQSNVAQMPVFSPSLMPAGFAFPSTAAFSGPQSNASLEQSLNAIAQDPEGKALLDEARRLGVTIEVGDPAASFGAGDKVLCNCPEHQVAKDQGTVVNGVTLSNGGQTRIIIRDPNNIKTIVHELIHAISGRDGNSRHEEGIADIVGHRVDSRLRGLPAPNAQVVYNQKIALYPELAAANGIEQTLRGLGINAVG